MCLVMCTALFSSLQTAFGVDAVNASAADGPVLKLHYHRPDGNYDGWDVWLWEYGKDGAGYAFENEGGEMVATMNVTPGVTSVGFIVRTASWDKDINEDQFIDIAEVVTGTVHIYVESGVKGYTKEYGDGATVGIKLKTAKYNMNGTIDVTATDEIGDGFENAFTVTDRNGELAITGVTYAGDNVYTIALAEELDLYGGTYSVIFEDNKYSVTMPILFSTDEFEAQYTYTGSDLGANWTKDATTFRVWAPTAESVYVNLYDNGTEGEGELTASLEMTPDVNGTWVCTREGDLNGVYYTYLVSVGGSENEAVDPYARTTGVNGARGMVIDLDATDPEGWAEDTNPHAGEPVTDAIIYEGHIRDLTVNSEGRIRNKGKYLGLTETATATAGGSATGTAHLVDLGVTHLHILPMYDFGSVDETSAINKYNWGYDPVNYNVPEGSYSSDPFNGAVRVSEVKQMVQTLHNSGISVVMDVVYNHVQSASEFCFNRIVPGYFSRVTDGIYSNGSGCGNDTASERAMVRKYIVDSVNYWADEYHIDGFRFDLVGLIDVDTVNEIVATVHEKHPDVIFYGEGWTMTTLVTKDNVELATQTNSTLTPGFSYFNDTIRDALKGSVFSTTTTGFVSGAAGMESKIERCFMGNDTWCASPSQTINYASCHDNNTLYDRITSSCPDASTEDIIKMNNLAAAIYLTAEGTPFMSAGEEMLRSKTNKDGTFNSNSYNAGDTVNSIKWANLDDPMYAAVYEYYKGLIAFRKEHAALRLGTPEEVEKYVSPIAGLDGRIVGFDIAGGQDKECSEAIRLLFNAETEAKTITLPEGEWKVCINDKLAGTDVIETVSGQVEVPAISALVLVKGANTAASETVTPAASDDGSTDTATNAAPADTTADPAPAGTDVSDQKDGVSAGLIIGIAAAVCVAVAAVVLILRKKKK